MKLILLITIVFITFLYYYCYTKWKNETKVQFTSNKKEYFIVQNNNQEPEWVSKEVANRLSKLTSKVDILVNEMYKTSYPSFSISKRLMDRWKKLRENPKGIRETGEYEKEAAYILNKGKQLRICVRNRKGGKSKFEDENTTMFVMLHELGHLMSETYGHNAEFKENFSSITQKAIELNLYTYENYSRENKSHCGTQITSSSV